MKLITIETINSVLNGTIIGKTNQLITAPEQLEAAKESEITFIGNKKYEKLWQNSKASAAVVNEDIAIEPGENRVFIKVKNADLAMSQVLELFAPPPPKFEIEIHPTAKLMLQLLLVKEQKLAQIAILDPMLALEKTA